MILQVSPVKNNIYKKQQNGQQNVNQNNIPSFGYASFLKDLPPHMNCPYCGKKMLSKKVIKEMGIAIENTCGQNAISRLRNYYDRLKPMQQGVIDILTMEIEKSTHKPVKNIITKLADTFEQNTNNEYSDAIIEAFNTSGITKKHRLYKILGALIDDSKKSLLSKIDKNSEQKVLRITTLQEKLSKLIKLEENQEDKQKLRKFFSTINSKFAYIKMDPRTFFPKYGHDELSGFLGNLYTPIRVTVDHIIPVSKNGASADSNYLATCANCNSLKGDKPLKDFVRTYPKVPNFIKKYFQQLDKMFAYGQRDKYRLSPDQRLEMIGYLSVTPKNVSSELGTPLNVVLPNLSKIMNNGEVK